MTLKLSAWSIIVAGTLSLEHLKVMLKLYLHAACLTHRFLDMFSLLTLGLLAVTAAAAPAQQLIGLTPSYSQGDSDPARFRYYEN